MEDTPHESSVIAERYEQLGPYEVQDHELVEPYHCAEAPGVAIDLV